MANQAYAAPPIFPYEAVRWRCTYCGFRVNGPWLHVGAAIVAHDKACDERGYARQKQLAEPKSS